jgi:hypothetical protein
MAKVPQKVLERLIDAMGQRIARKFLKAISKMSDRAQINTLTGIIEEIKGEITSKVLDRVLDAAGIRFGTLNEVTEEVRAGYYEAGTFYIGEEVPLRFGAVFDLGNLRAEKWLENRSSQLITQLTNTQREVVQEHLLDGFINGRNPHAVALDMVGRVGPAAGGPKSGRRQGGIYGLNMPQLKLTQDMRTALEGAEVGIFGIDKNGHKIKKFWIGDDGKLKSVYTRRDHRFDGTILKAIREGKKLPQSKINRLISRYSDRLLELRGSTIGRTEALSAMNEAQHESLRQVVDNGYAEEDAIIRIWRHSHQPNERPGHLYMDGQERGLNKKFINPATGIELMHPNDGPGSESINCRCRVQHDVDFISLEGGGPPRKPKPDKPWPPKPKPKPKAPAPKVAQPEKKKPLTEKKREPWEQTKAEYDAKAKLKPQKSFFIDPTLDVDDLEELQLPNTPGPEIDSITGEILPGRNALRGKVEVIRNPDPRTLGQFKKEALKEFYTDQQLADLKAVGAYMDPVLRYTEDADGNRYYWKASDAIHMWIEPELSRLEGGVYLNQSAASRESHRSVIRRALYRGKKVPQYNLDIYPGLLDEVRGIKGNKVSQVLSESQRLIKRPDSGLAGKFYENTLKKPTKDFTGEMYLDNEQNALMQAYLRGEPIDELFDEDEIKAAKDAADDILRRWDSLSERSQQEMTVFRGFSTDDIKQFKVGATISDDGFWATATNEADAGRFVLAGGGEKHVFMEIDTPTGTQFWSPNSNVRKGYFEGPRFFEVEKELVLAPGSQFEVVEVRTEMMTVYDMWEDDMKEVEVTRVIVKKIDDKSFFGGLLDDDPAGPKFDKHFTAWIEEGAEDINSVGTAVDWVRENSQKDGNEYGVILGPDSRLLDARKGEENYIPYGSTEDVFPEGYSIGKIEGLMKGGTYVHSHPGDAALSSGDIYFANHYELDRMTAVGKDIENYYLASEFKKEKSETLKMFGALKQMRRDIHQEIWEAGDSISEEFLGDYWEPMTLRQRTLDGDVPFSQYEKQMAEWTGLIDDVHTAKTILINELVADYGGYNFEYSLQKGAYNRRIQEIMDGLIESGFVDHLEDEFQGVLRAMRDMWTPNRFDD